MTDSHIAPPLEMTELSPVLVTGAAGLVGRAVVKELQVRLIAPILAPTREELDLCDATATEKFFARYRPATVVHLAAAVFGLGGNLARPVWSLLRNTEINHNLFSALAKHPAKRFFFAGTVASYPYPFESDKLREDDFFNGLPHGGEFGYAMAKRHAHTYLVVLSKETGLQYTYGILTNMYGEHDRFEVATGHVIPSLIAKAHSSALDGRALEVWGDGQAERDFLYVGDASRAIMACLLCDHMPQLINIASGRGASIRDVAERIAAHAGISNVHYRTDKPTGILRRVADNTRLRDLGVVSEVDLDSGLKRVYDWYSSNVSGARR